MNNLMPTGCLETMRSLGKEGGKECFVDEREDWTFEEAPRLVVGDKRSERRKRMMSKSKTANKTRFNPATEITAGLGSNKG